MTSILEWLEEWYKDNCDGEWEHEYAIKIETVDNPGWSIKIDLSYTSIESLNIEMQTNEVSESDWYSYKVKDKIFSAGGDPNKLSFLLEKFKEIIEANT